MKKNEQGGIDTERIAKLLDAAEASLRSARAMLGTTGRKEGTIPTPEPEGQVVEGVFDGQNMLAPDGRQFPVPANYASKSKLVAGDILKCTIAQDGTFVYKQIGPVEKKKIVGILGQEGNDFVVTANGKPYKILKASVTYYKAEPGDEVAIIIPSSGESEWAAVDNIVTMKPEQE